MRKRETLGSVWRKLQKRLEAAGIEPMPREGRVLVAHVLGLSEAEAVKREGEDFPTFKLAELDAFSSRRVKGEPLAYITGSAPFWSRDWRVGPGVLIPRPDSEVLVREVLARVREDGRILEVGLGSGCLMGSVLDERRRARGVGTDISPAALAMARLNLADAGVIDRCEVREGDLLANAEGPFDVVMSNPPYIADDEWALLEPGVRDFEPELALRAGALGMDIYERLVPAAHYVLAPGGWLCVEMGWLQGEAVKALFERHGFERVEILCDLAARDRVVVGMKAAHAV